MKKLLAIIAFLFLAHTANAQSLWSGVLNSQRAIDWTQAGAGNIPSGSWTQCGATIAAYTGTAAAINAQLSGCSANQYVLLGAGTFNLSTCISITGKSNLALRGSGANSTFLTFSANSLCGIYGNSTFIAVTSSDNTVPATSGPTAREWTAGYAKGATTITLSTGVGIVANVTTIVVDQCNTGLVGSVGTGTCTGTPTDNGNWFSCDIDNATCGAANGPNTQARLKRGQFEFLEAVSCSPACGTASSTVVTLKTPLQHPNWSAGQTPQAWLLQPSQSVGLENFSINVGTSTTQNAIGFLNISYGWVSGVRIANAWQAGLMCGLCNHMTIQSNYFYDTGRSGAMIDPYHMRLWGANYLIQNNILQKNRAAITFEGGAPGSVIAYNYLVNAFYPSDTFFGGFEPHAMGNDLILAEGNIAPGWNGESLHGGAETNIQYRNFYTGWESCGNGQCGAQTLKDSSTNAILWAGNARYQAAVGNVLGTPGQTNKYITNSNYDAIYRMGNNIDNALVQGTALLYGNWDAKTNATRWCKDASSTNWAVVGNCNSISEIPTGAAVYPVNLADVTLGDIAAGQGALPNSFYLSGRPSWYPVSVPFPAIGPDVSLGTIGQCTGVKNTVGQFALLPATASAQCAPTTGFGFNASAWGGHVNANPAMLCYIAMGGNADGTSGLLAFDPTTCYAAATAPAVNLTWSGGAFPMAFGGHVQGVASGALVGTLTNTGTGTLTYSLISVTGTNAADFVVTPGVTNPCVILGSTLAAGASCTFSVVFTPSVCGGGYPCAKTANLRVDSNATSTPDLGVLTGTSTVAPTGNGTPSTPTLTGMLWTNDKYAFYHCTSYPCATICYSCSLPIGVKRPVITFK